jgi:hypothetical protein
VVNVNDIAQVVIAVTSVASLLVGLHNRRQIAVVETATNSMKDALIAGATREGTAAGLAQGRAEAR